jgi:hypothetical protein
LSITHIHLWKLDHLRYPWLTGPFDDNGPNGSVEAIAADYLPADYTPRSGRLERWPPCMSMRARTAQALDETHG